MTSRLTQATGTMVRSVRNPASVTQPLCASASGTSRPSKMSFNGHGLASCMRTAPRPHPNAPASQARLDLRVGAK